MATLPLELVSTILSVALPVLQVVASLQKNRRWGWIPMGMVMLIVLYWLSWPQSYYHATMSGWNAVPWLLVVLELGIIHLICRHIVKCSMRKGDKT